MVRKSETEKENSIQIKMCLTPDAKKKLLYTGIRVRLENPVAKEGKARKRKPTKTLGLEALVQRREREREPF